MTEHNTEFDQMFCSGACLTGADIGVGGSGIDDIAYPHPDCERHGHLWTPHDNDWSRQYVADHRQHDAPEECCDGCRKASQILLAEVFAAERARHCGLSTIAAAYVIHEWDGTAPDAAS